MYNYTGVYNFIAASSLYSVGTIKTLTGSCIPWQCMIDSHALTALYIH